MRLDGCGIYADGAFNESAGCPATIPSVPRIPRRPQPQRPCPHTTQHRPMGCHHHPTGLPQAPGPGQAAATVTRPAGARPAADATARPDGHTGRAASTQTQRGRSLAIPPGKALRPGPFVVTAIQIVIIGIAVVAMLGVHLLLRHTRLGQAMRATATNAALARNCGIRTDLVIDMVWLLSGILCGIGGVALVANITSFDFGTGGQFIILILPPPLLGGVGHPSRAIIGAPLHGYPTSAWPR